MKCAITFIRNKFPLFFSMCCWLVLFALIALLPTAKQPEH